MKQKTTPLLFRIFLMYLVTAVTIFMVLFFALHLFKPEKVFPFFRLAMLTGFILIILLISFITLRLMMKPVQYLLQGAEELANGNLKFRMPTAGNARAVRIGESFNSIAERLDQLVTNKDVLLRDVSHELRSPLARISVAVEMLQETELKKSIRDDVRKIDQLVNQILESYRLRSGAFQLKKAKVHLREFLEAIVEDYRTGGPGVKEISVDDHVEVNIDSMMMERVIRNLIENAQKYSAASAKPIEISCLSRESGWELIIQDHGSGIAKEDQQKVFDPFYRTDRARTSNEKSGFGLGLSICKSIVDAHGFTLRLESDLGQGTKISIFMPQS